MSKYKYSMDENKIQNYIKEKRGQGFGKDYKPWIDVRGLPSRGKVSRCYGWKTQRIHHFMSSLETSYFYLLEWADNVVDIREQFPLLERDICIGIAEEKGIKYPKDLISNTPIVLTTDFLITTRENGKDTYLARTIKPSSDLEKKRVIEKFEIERVYWEKKGIDWGIVTEKEIPKDFVLNIEWVYSSYSLESINEISVESLKRYCEILIMRLKKYRNMIVRDLVSDLDKEYSLDSGIFLYLLRHLIATKRINILGMDKRVNLNKCIEELLCVDIDLNRQGGMHK